MKHTNKKRPKLIAIPDENIGNLKAFLDPVVTQVEVPEYIASDPVAFMHRFDDAEDRNLAGFLSALLAWGRRDIVMAKIGDLLARFGTTPADFIGNMGPADEARLEGFRHRTFTADDIRWILRALRGILQQNGTFASFWASCYREAKEHKSSPLSQSSPPPSRNRDELPHSSSPSSRHRDGFAHSSSPSSRHRDGFALISKSRPLLSVFHDRFFDHIPDAPARVGKHIASPDKKSSCKRLYLFLRWVVRSNSCVDPGTMPFMPPSELMIPLDVHVARYARMLGLVTRPANDWRTVCELTGMLRKMDPADPARYDYALFGLGIHRISIPEVFILNHGAEH